MSIKGHMVLQSRSCGMSIKGHMVLQSRVILYFNQGSYGTSIKGHMVLQSRVIWYFSQRSYFPFASHFSLTAVAKIALFPRYYRVNEVQKFTYSRRTEESTDVSVSITLCCVFRSN